MTAAFRETLVLERYFSHTRGDFTQRFPYVCGSVAGDVSAADDLQRVDHKELRGL